MSFTEEIGGRTHHANCDQVSRLRKARKIVALLESERELAGATVLDVGTGSGHVASFLSKVVGPSGSVQSVDVVDVRADREGYEYRQIEGTALPFPDHRFDVAISNHVIEHVGTRREQLHHLNEIRRVLTPMGVLYLATPNRWTLIEPHFGLPALGWLPNALQSLFLTVTRKGKFYDCRLLSRSDLFGLLREADLTGQERTLEALAIMVGVEADRRVLKLASSLPHRLLKTLLPIMPTLIVVARPNDRR